MSFGRFVSYNDFVTGTGEDCPSAYDVTLGDVTKWILLIDLEK